METETTIETSLLPVAKKVHAKLLDPQLEAEVEMMEQDKKSKTLDRFRAIRFVWENK